MATEFDGSFTESLGAWESEAKGVGEDVRVIQLFDLNQLIELIPVSC